jgi:hypothetical protein
MTFFPTPAAECIWTAASSGKSIGGKTQESKEAGSEAAGQRIQKTPEKNPKP